MHHNQYEPAPLAKANARETGHHETPIDLTGTDFTHTRREGVAVTELRFFTVPEIADLLQMKRERVYEAVRLGLVPAVHIGRQIRIEQKAFVDWVRGGGQTCAAGWRHQAS